MNAPCSHPVGYIPGDGFVAAAEWNVKLAAFAIKVVDFNNRGQREQIAHPGFIQEFRFCPVCGKQIDREALDLMTYGQALDSQAGA